MIWGLLGAVPVDPDAPVAKQWIIDELAKPAYQAAKPTLFDRIAKAIGDWLQSLTLGNISGPPALGIAVVIGLVVLGIVVAFLVFGVPRLNRRSAVTGSLFGEHDERDAAQIRRDADAAARAGDFSTAVIEMFRAMARGLAERTVVNTSPGTTAHDFAARASLAFPPLAERLGASAAAFDTVRYLGHPGTAEQFLESNALERELRSARPALDPVRP